MNWFTACLLVLPLMISGCASIDRCQQVGGFVFDVTELSVARNGELLAAGVDYELKNCAFEELVRQGGPRAPHGLLWAVSGDNGKSWQAKRIHWEIPASLPKGYEVRGLSGSRQGALYVGINHLPLASFARANNYARLLRSVDAGGEWTQAADFGRDHIENVIALSDSVVIAALCEQGILRSGDNGKTWISTGLRRVDNQSCNTLVLIHNNVGDLYAYGWGKNGPGFYRSVDQGISWTRLNVPLKGWVGHLAANDRGDVVAATSGPWVQDMHVSGDRGKTWKQVKPPYEFWTEQLAVGPDGSILVKSMDNILASGGSYRSTDQGASWSRLNNRWTGENSIPGWNSLVTGASGHLFVRKKIDFSGLPSSWGWGGTVYYSRDSGSSWEMINPLVDKVPE